MLTHVKINARPFLTAAVVSMIGLGVSHAAAADQPSADASYLTACKAAPSDACRTLARQHKEGLCQAGDGLACLVLGNVYRLGYYVAADPAKANHYYQLASRILDGTCQGGSATACATLGDLYEFGRGVAVDPTRAERLAQRARRLTPPTRAVAEDD